MDHKKCNGRIALNKSEGKPNHTKSAHGKADKWWTTPRTQAFIETREALEIAYDELMCIEADLYLEMKHKMARHRNHNANPLMQSLTHECVNFLVKQEMAQSPRWQEAWQRFSSAVIAAEQAAAEFREEIEHATARKPKATAKVTRIEIQATQTTISQTTGKRQQKIQHSA